MGPFFSQPANESTFRTDHPSVAAMWAVLVANRGIATARQSCVVHGLHLASPRSRCANGSLTIAGKTNAIAHLGALET